MSWRWYAMLAAALAALGVAPTTRAQSARGAAPAADLAPGESLLQSVNAARLTPGKWTYVARLMTDGPPSRLGFRTLELVPATYAGTAAWLFVDAQQIARLSFAESLYVTRADLSPLHLGAHRPGAEVVEEFSHDSIRATFSGDSATRRVAVANRPGVLTTPSMLEVLLQQLPLHPGWRGSASMLAISRDGGTTVPVTVRVTGEESARIPDGTFDCWVVSLEAGQAAQRLWVRKNDRLVLKTSAPAIGMTNAEVQLLLAEGQLKK